MLLLRPCLDFHHILITKANIVQGCGKPNDTKRRQNLKTEQEKKTDRDFEIVSNLNLCCLKESVIVHEHDYQFNFPFSFHSFWYYRFKKNKKVKLEV